MQVKKKTTKSHYHKWFIVHCSWYWWICRHNLHGPVWLAAWKLKLIIAKFYWQWFVCFLQNLVDIRQIIFLLKPDLIMPNPQRPQALQVSNMQSTYGQCRCTVKVLFFFLVWIILKIIKAQFCALHRIWMKGVPSFEFETKVDSFWSPVAHHIYKE